MSGVAERGRVLNPTPLTTLHRNGVAERGRVLHPTPLTTLHRSGVAVWQRGWVRGPPLSRTGIKAPVRKKMICYTTTTHKTYYHLVLSPSRPKKN